MITRLERAARELCEQHRIDPDAPITNEREMLAACERIFGDEPGLSDSVKAALIAAYRRGERNGMQRVLDEIREMLNAP